MRKTIRRSKFGYALAAVLCFVGVAAMLVVLWETWPQISSSPEPLSAFWEALWATQLAPIPGIKLRLIALTVFSAAMLGIGGAVLLYSRQWFYLPGERVKLQCPFCKKLWKARHYPEGQVLCPHCHHQVNAAIAAE